MSSLEGEAVVAVLRIGQIILPKTVSFSSTIEFLKVGIEPRDPHLQGAGAFVHGPKHGHEPVMWFLLLLFCGNFVKDRLWIGFVFFGILHRIPSKNHRRNKNALFGVCLGKMDLLVKITAARCLQASPK